MTKDDATTGKTRDVVAEALAVYTAHKDDPHPAVAALRAVLATLAARNVRIAELLAEQEAARRSAGARP